MHASKHDTPPHKRTASTHAVALCGLLAVVWAGHAASLDDGLFLDDHWHQHSLSDASWTLPDLIEASTLQPQRFIQAWWQDKELTWQYGRPLTMAFMKAVQQWSSGSVQLQHAASIFWHALTVILLYILAFQVTRRVLWAGFVGAMFAVYPHTAYAVGWLAAQNTIIQTALTLAALLLYAHASRLTMHAAVAAERPTGALPLRRSTYCAAVAVFLMALLSRENAIVFPALAAALDLAFGGRTHLRARWLPLAGFGVVAAAFVVWRMTLFDSAIPEVYCRRPQDWSYVPWAVAKLLHYVACTIWLTPMVIGPTRHANPFLDAPGDCVLMIIVIAVLGTGYTLACRGHIRGYWVWPLWIVLSVLPVVPLMATPHSGYMSGVGFIMALAMKPSQVQASRARGAIAVAAWFVLTGVFTFTLYRVCWRGVVRSEQLAITQLAAKPAPAPGTTVFLIDLPLANIYLPLNLHSAWQHNAADLPCEVLTFSNDVLQGSSKLSVEQIDAYRFVLSREGPGFFSGLLGEFLRRAMRQDPVLAESQVIAGNGFTVQIQELGSGGVRRLLFDFEQPLADGRKQFYVMDPDNPGAALQFLKNPPPGGVIVTPTTPPDSTEAAACRTARARLFKTIENTARFVRTDLYMTGN